MAAAKVFGVTSQQRGTYFGLYEDPAKLEAAEAKLEVLRQASHRTSPAGSPRPQPVPKAPATSSAKRGSFFGLYPSDAELIDKLSPRRSVGGGTPGEARIADSRAAASSGRRIPAPGSPGSPSSPRRSPRLSPDARDAAAIRLGHKSAPSPTIPEHGEDEYISSHISSMPYYKRQFVFSTPQAKISVPLVSLGHGHRGPGDGGHEVPAATPTVIIGCWQLSEAFRQDANVVPEEQFRALAYMLTRGACAVDTGDVGASEEEEKLLGRFQASRHAMEAQLRSGLRMRIHTKFAPDLDSLGRVDVGHVEATLRRSIRRLNLPHGHILDLVQLHWWDLKAGDYVNAVRQLARFAAGQHAPDCDVLFRSIGLTNFGVKETAEILDTGIVVSSVQVQLSLLDRRPVGSGLLELCARRGVSVLTHGTLAGGLLSDRYLGLPEPEWVQAPELAPTRSLTKYALILQECGGWQRLQQLLALLKEVADRRVLETNVKVSIAQVAIAWCMRQTAVSACVLGLPNGAGDEDTPGRGRASELAEAAELDLSDAEVAMVELELRSFGLSGGKCYDLERERDGPHGRIMKYKSSHVGEDEHAKEVLQAWGDIQLRLAGGNQFAVRCAWEARYCLGTQFLSPELQTALGAALEQMDAAIPSSLEHKVHEKMKDHKNKSAHVGRIALSQQGVGSPRTLASQSFFASQNSTPGSKLATPRQAGTAKSSRVSSPEQRRPDTERSSSIDKLRATPQRSTSADKSRAAPQTPQRSSVIGGDGRPKARALGGSSGYGPASSARRTSN